MDLRRPDLDAATRAGLIDASQADALWRFLDAQQQHQRAGFRPAHILYYLGGMIAISAMTTFMTLGWERFGGAGLLVIAVVYGTGAVAAAHWLLHRRQLPIPAGILGTLAVALVPLAVYGLQNLMGWWAEGEAVRDYHRHIDGRWLMMEVATLAAGAAMLWRFRLPFLVIPVAVTLWYLSMDLTPFLVGQPDVDWGLRKLVSLYFGLLIIGLAFWVDLRSRHGPDFAFWLYLAGVLAFWGGLSSMSSDSEWSKAGYAAINLGLIAIGALLSRRVFAVFGGLGLAGYLGHLAYTVFKDSLWFPFALTLIGLAVIGAGIAWQRHEQVWAQRLRSYLPTALRELIEARA
jgi:hypothetical protein